MYALLLSFHMFVTECGRFTALLIRVRGRERTPFE